MPLEHDLVEGASEDPKSMFGRDADRQPDGVAPLLGLPYRVLAADSLGTREVAGFCSRAFFLLWKVSENFLLL